jgi:hypothetical protein
VRHELRGSATGSVFRLGDAMRVRVEKVDAVLRRVDLVPIVEPTPIRPRTGRTSGRKRTRQGRKR